MNVPASPRRTRLAVLAAVLVATCASLLPAPAKAWDHGSWGWHRGYGWHHGWRGPGFYGPPRVVYVPVGPRLWIPAHWNGPYWVPGHWR